MALGHFLLGSHNVMVMALGSCVEWPLGGPSPFNICDGQGEILLSLMRARLQEFLFQIW